MSRRNQTLVAGLAILSVLLTALWQPVPALAQTPPVSVVEYYHLDALGSVRVVTDDIGQVIARHDFLPFGEEWPSSTNAKQKKLFTGHERDADTGLDYFGARYYRPQVGRFTTIDPAMTLDENLVDPQRWNRYAYVLNNPLKYTDPDGKFPVAVAAAIPGPQQPIIVVGIVVVAGAAVISSPGARQAIADGFSWFTTRAADAIASVFHTEKRPGTKGKPDHQQTVEEERARIGGESEVPIQTPGAKKNSRRADAVGTNPETGAQEIVQVYRPTSGGNIPKREKDAAADIGNATGIKPTLVPVRPPVK